MPVPNCASCGIGKKAFDLEQISSDRQIIVSKAPVVTLVAKDRVLAHNPIGVVY